MNTNYTKGSCVVKKYLFVVLFLFVSVCEAKTLDVEYKVSFGILGELGVSHARLETHGNKYSISIDAKATGIAKSLSRDRKEKHLSEGFIRNGIYHAKSYTMEVTYGEKRRVKYYTIDHRTKSVTKKKQTYEKGKLVSESTEKLDFYSSDDLLTLYFNLSKYLGKNPKEGKHTFRAVGAEKQRGKVEVYLPASKELSDYIDQLGEGEYRYLTAVIYQKIFDSNKGELMLAIGSDGITQKAVLKDLIMFGDLEAERVK